MSQWADEHRQLSPEANPEGGKWDTATAEYQRGMMDAITDPEVTSIVLMMGAQVGKTELINNTVGYFISEDPCPMLVVQPSLDMCQSWSKDRLAPMIRDTPVLRGLVKDPKAKDSGNTVLHKTFTGGQLTIVGANSPTGLAARPIRIVLQDEIDKYPVSAGTEGDPCNLADARTKNFWNSKRIKASTPTEATTSRIVKAFEASDQRYYHIHCPACGAEQRLVWEQVKWGKHPDGTHATTTALYHCLDCDHGINDVERHEAVRHGKWIAMAPFNGIAGFHINGLYSPWTKLADLAFKFVQAKHGGNELLKAFITNELGEPWTQDTQHLDPNGFMSRLEDYTAELLPEGIHLLTAGVDVQDDRLVVEVKGWHRDQSWSVDWRTFKGTPTSNAPVWAELDAYLKKAWPLNNGPALTISSALIDSGGHYTSAVYDFCRYRAGRRVYPCKGASTAGQPVVSTSKKAIEGCQLHLVGTDTAKGVIHAYLKNEEVGQGFWHFSQHHNDLDYFKQLVAEKLTLAYKNGQYVHQWKAKPGVRNEALDCTVYAYAALQALNVDWPSVEQAIALASATLAQRRQTQATAAPPTREQLERQVNAPTVHALPRQNLPSSSPSYKLNFGLNRRR